MIIKVLIKVFDKSVFVLLSEKFFILRYREEFFFREKFFEIFLEIFFRNVEIRLSKNKKRPSRVSPDAKKVYLQEKNFLQLEL